MNNATWLVTNDDKLYYITDAKIIEDISEVPKNIRQLVKSFTRGKEDSDLLWFTGTYCTANVRNHNGDGFKYADLVKVADTPRFKPINWLHNESEKVGVIIESKLINISKNEGFIQIIGVVWQGTDIDRAYAEMVRANFQNGTMGLSMECFGTEVECSNCGEIFPISKAGVDNPFAHYCSHLQERYSSNTTRWIKDPLFVGVGLIPALMEHAPADDTAWVKEIASIKNPKNDREEEDDMADKYTKEQVDELVKAAEAKKDAEFDERLKEKDTELAEANDKVSSIETELDKIKEDNKDITTIQEELDSTKAKLEETNTERDGLAAELKEYKDKEAEEAKATFELRSDELKKSAKLNDEQIEALKAHIMDDEKYASLKQVLVKEVDDNDSDIKVLFESKSKKVQDAEAIIRDAMKRDKS